MLCFVFPFFILYFLSSVRIIVIFFLHYHYTVLHIDPWLSHQSDSLNRMHLWKKVEAVTWLIGNVWALWNDICRCPHEGLGQSESWSLSLQSRRASCWGSSPQLASGWLLLPHDQEAEMLSGALKTMQRYIVKRRSHGLV